jgi:hypothetical protein
MSSEKAGRSNRKLSRVLRMVRYSLSILAALFLLAAPSGYAATWDVTADFPGTTTNPNGAWSYGWENYVSPDPQGDFAQFDYFGYAPHGNSPFWNMTSPDRGGVWKNLGTPIYGVNTGEVSFAPGSAGGCAVVRWTSPIDGTVSIDGTFGAGDSFAESYYISKNNSNTWIWSKFGTYEDGAFSLTEEVTTGTTIDFIVGGNFMFGNTPLAATINPVPIPGAVCLLGSGLLGLAGLRRFRKA